MKTAFIGGGNMARAIIGGLVAQGFDAADIAVKDPHEEKRAALTADFGAAAFDEAADWITAADLVVLAVKPQGLEACLKETAQWISPDATVLSIAAAVSVDAIARWSGKSRIVRCLPNTPAMAGCGFSGLYAGQGAGPEDRARAQKVMESVGSVVWVADEAQLHVVTAGPGSGPAYVFLFMEALADALVQAGADAGQAREMALSTVYGAASLAKASGEDFALLRQKVTSKGGTTAKAIEALEAGDFRGLIGSAVKACIARSEEMAELYK